MTKKPKAQQSAQGIKKLGNTKVGLVESEPIQETVSTLGESVLDIQKPCSSMRYSLSQEMKQREILRSSTPNSTLG